MGSNITAHMPRFDMLSDELLARWPTIATILAMLVIAKVVQSFLKPDPLAGVPIVGQGGRHERRKQFMSGKARELYSEGYSKFNEGIFRITTARESEVLVISPKYLPELGKLPDDTLSFTGAINEAMEAKYTDLRGDSPLILPHTVKTSLTPALVRLNPTIAEEVVEAMRMELPQTSEWTEININKKLLRIVAMASGRIFVGPELCRDETYLDSSVNYTIDLMTAVHVIMFIPTWLRPVVAPYLPTTRKLRKRAKEADSFLRPVVAARRKAAEEPEYKKPDDMLQWIMDSQSKFGAKGDEELAKVQLNTSFAAIHTTTLTTTNAVYTLAAMPELTPVLREDVQQALAASNGEFTSSAMQNMKKLDSFMKEVIRFYPMSAGSFQRKVLKPFMLSNGQMIPAGVIIEAPASSVSADPSIFPNPEEFDAMRFYNLRLSKNSAATGAKAAETVANSQFVSVSSSSLTFGYGRHACPGRFFAANEIKMILATMVLHYDIKNINGEKERYKNLVVGGRLMPDSKKTVLMRKL